METGSGFEEFVAIVEGGSVTAAAEALGLPRPTVSRRLARLEERLGVRLLHRTTRRLKTTAEGRLLYARARRVVDAAHEAEAAVRRLDGTPRGLLRVSVPTSLPRETMGVWVAEYLAEYPEVELEFVASLDFVDLVADGFDIALRRGVRADDTLIQRVLRVDASIAIASPDYLERRGVPTDVEALAEHECILGHRTTGTEDDDWPLSSGGRVRVSGRFRSNQAELRLGAARAGLGIAVTSALIVREELEAGHLVHVLPDLVGTQERVSLVYVDREFVDPKVRSFVDFLSGRVGPPR